MNTAPHRHHPVRLAGPRGGFGGAQGAAPLLLQRADDDFVESTLHELATAAPALAASRAQATTAQGVLKLFQPIQRQFHLVLLEAWCDTPGLPRLDPAQVESAGYVLRRLDVQGRPEGWMKSAGQVRGWVPLLRLGGDTLDPLAAGRAAAAATGVDDIDRLLQAQARLDPLHALDEDSAPLFVAPPDVCQAAGRTLMYGVVATSSSEQAPAAPAAAVPAFGPDSTLFAEHLVAALKGEAMAMPFAGRTLVGRWADVLEATGTALPEGVTLADANALRSPGAEQTALRLLLLLLRQLGSEFGAFDAPTEATAEARAVRAVLDDITLPLVRRSGETVPRRVRASDFLASASRVLLERDPGATAPEMPERWPALDAAVAQRLKRALHASMQQRLATLTRAGGRYAEPDARYVLRAFLRLKPEPGCKPRLVWSEPSRPFVIAPWYEGAGAPPVQINLPDPSNRKLLRSLKPNVAFVVPPGLQNLLSGPAKDLLEGKGSTGSLGITWVCGFSIPIITICAFIVLNIFLTLLNIVFGWMFFLKICLPLPALGNKRPGTE